MRDLRLRGVRSRELRSRLIVTLKDGRSTLETLPFWFFSIPFQAELKSPPAPSLPLKTASCVDIPLCFNSLTSISGRLLYFIFMFTLSNARRNYLATFLPFPDKTRLSVEPCFINFQGIYFDGG